MEIAKDDGALMAALHSVLSSAGINDSYVEAERILTTARVDEVADAGHTALVMAQARASGIPLSYVLGRQRFMGIEIAVAPGVLIPRDETELLGWEAVVRMREKYGPTGRGARIIDMCCGSGNLACGMAHALPEVEVWATDLMEDCAALTARNAQRLGFATRIHSSAGDLFVPLAKTGQKYDAVVCNPPYISTHRLSHDRQDLLSHEPRTAFDGGPYGLSIYQRLVRDAAPFIRKGGWLLFEMGVGQAAPVERLLKRVGDYDKIEPVLDQRGDIRVVAARRS
ncbi:MAG: N5-glutamine methyltransferase family protein [Acidiferrobacter sp.]